MAQGPTGTILWNPCLSPNLEKTFMKCAVFTSLYVIPRTTEVSGKWSISGAHQHC